MDKDELFKILDKPNSVTFTEYFDNQSWIEESCLVNVVPKTAKERIHKSPSHGNKEKSNKTESNLMKIYSHLIEDNYHNEKISKEVEEAITEQASMLASSIHERNDEFYERKLNLYENFILGYTGMGTKTNALIYSNDPSLEKYALSERLIQESFPGLKPIDSWPMLLDDLIEKLKTVAFEEIFYQPFDLETRNNFYNEAIEVIYAYDTKLTNDPNEEDKAYFTKSIIVLLTIAIKQGDFKTLYKVIDQLSSIKHKPLLQTILQSPEASSDNILLKTLKELYSLASDNNYLPYPIMRNYSIIDYFNLSQVILYSKNKQHFSDCSICSDGSYIYAIVTGVNGCKMKIGTGYNGTIRGKVYKHIIMPEEASFQWVYCKGKIYLKTYSPTFPLKDYDYLTVISPESLEVEGRIKLVLPKKITHSLVASKNENFTLISDGNVIGILVLEPSSSNDPSINDNTMTSSEAIDLEAFTGTDELIQQVEYLHSMKKDQFSYINLELITYDPKERIELKDLGKETIELIEELYESFCHYYTKEECYKAMQKKQYDLVKTANYLAENPIEIKQDYIEGSKPLVLFQSKFEIIIKGGKMDKIIIPNPYFDVIEYNYLKWSMTDELVIAHKLKEGACGIFGRKQSDMKSYEYQGISIMNLIQSKDKNKKDKPKDKEKEANEASNDSHSQKIKGTLIKMIPAIHLSKYEYLITYDPTLKCYFLFSAISLPSQSILVCDTYVNTAKLYHETIFNNHLDKLNAFFTELKDKVDFDALLGNIIQLMLVMTSSRKYDSYCRYKNWNYAYNCIIESMINRIDTFGSLSNGIVDYSQPLLKNTVSESILNRTGLVHRIDKLAEVNRNMIMKQMPKVLMERFDMKEVAFNGNDAKEKKKMKNPIKKIRNVGNWRNETSFIFKKKNDGIVLTDKEIEELKENTMMHLDNKRVFFLCLDGELSSIEFLLQLFEDETDRKLLLSKEEILKLIYVWVGNINDSLILTSPEKYNHLMIQLKAIIERYITSKTDPINKEICIRILLEGWEHFAPDYSCQISYLKLFHEHQSQSSPINPNVNLLNIEQSILHYGHQYPFSILFQKLDMTRSSQVLSNNFNKINTIKSYSFHYIIYNNTKTLFARPSFNSLSPQSIQSPFYWGLFSNDISNLLQANPSHTNDTMIYYNDKMDSNEKEMLSHLSLEEIKLNQSISGLSLGVNRISYDHILFRKRHIENNNKESLWSFIISRIEKDGNDSSAIDCYIAFLNKMLSLALSDMHKFTLIIQQNNETLLLNNLNSLYVDFIHTAHNHLRELSQVSRSDNKRVSYLNLYSNFLYSLFTKISNCSLRTLAIIKDIILIAKKDFASLTSMITLLNEQGIQIENSKGCEYIISNDEITSISKKVAFPSNIIVVLLDFKISKADSKNHRDLVCMSEYHASSNFCTNNLNKYGTCYQTQLNANFDKIFYLKGKEIRLVSPTVITHSKLQASKTNTKSFLKIKCFPYNNQLALIQASNGDNGSSDIEALVISIGLLQDVEYFNAEIEKNLLKSFDIEENESLRKDSIAKLGLKAYGEAEELYEKYYSGVVYNNANYTSCGVFDSIIKGSASSYNTTTTTTIDIEDYVKMTRNKIREKTLEPNDYVFLKKIPSFVNEYKTMWDNAECSILQSLLYHLGLCDEFRKAMEKNSMIVVEPFFEMLGKKLNIVMSHLASKAKELKQSYDTIKSNLEDYINEYGVLYAEVKEKIMGEIVVGIAGAKKGMASKKGKDNLISGGSKKNMKFDNKFYSKKEAHSKRKKNAKRLYSELPKKKFSTQQEANEQVDKDLDENEDKNINDKIDDNAGIETLITKYQGYISKDTHDLVIKLQYLYKGYQAKIEAETHDAFFGNPSMLKEICDTHQLQYNSTNPSESIKSYSTYLYNQFLSFLPSTYQSLPSHPLESPSSTLQSHSPFLTVLKPIIEKSSFLLSLNHFNEQTNEDLPFLERLPSINRENSRTNSTRRTKSKNSEENNNYLLNPSQVIILRSLMNFILSQTETVPDLQRILYKQYLRGKIRSLSLRQLSLSYKDPSLLSASNYTLGIISSAVKSDIRIGIESTKLDNSPQAISIIMNYCLNVFAMTIQSIKQLTIQSTTTAPIHHKPLIVQINTREITHNKMETVSQLNLLFKRLLLVLSDINILFKEIKRNVHKYTEQNLIDIKLYSKFIINGIEILFTSFKRFTSSTMLQQTRKYCNDLIRTILTRIIVMSSLTSLNAFNDIIFTELANELSKAIDAKDEDNIVIVLEIISQLLHNGNESSCLGKLSSIMLDLIEQCERYEIISLASRLLLQLFKIANQTNSINVTKLFTKIGKLFMFNTTSSSTTSTIIGEDSQLNHPKITKENEGMYHVVIQMNSTEIDYQFLVNALYYWEEKYPTQLSENIEALAYPMLKVNEETGFKVEKFSYFNVIKAKTNKMHLLDNIVNERIANITRALTEANAMKNDKKKDKEDKSIDSRILLLKKEEKYQERIRSHIKLAQDIGENASIRGFAIIDPPLIESQAKEFAEIIHKASNGLLPHFKANLIDDINLFNDEIIFPKMPKKEVMSPGCMNTLKETTKSFVNVTLVNEAELGRLKDNWKYFIDQAKKSNSLEDKKVKNIASMKRFVPDYSPLTIQLINYNNPAVQKIVNRDSLSGVAITIMIESLIHLIYAAYQKDLNGLIKQIRIRLQKLKEEWSKEKDNSNEGKFNTLGMVIVMNDFYRILHRNSKVMINNNSIGHIIQGGDKSGKLVSDVIIPSNPSSITPQSSSSSLKIERIQTDLLVKFDHNSKLIKNIPFSEITDAIVYIYDLFQSNKDLQCNKHLLHLLLKTLNLKKIEQDDLSNYLKKKKESFDKLLLILNAKSNSVIWLEQEEKRLENEFIELFQRIYDKIDLSNHRIYSPKFILDLNTASSFPIDKLATHTDIITNSTLPDTNYVKQIPKLTDFSKSNDSLKNIQVFDKYLVMEIFNYCKSHYRDAEYENSLTQVRHHLANGDLKNAVIDLNTIFDDRQTAPHVTLLKEHYDSDEITKEEIFPGNYYRAKLTKKFMRQSGIKSLIKLGSIGINEITVLVLLQDNAINQALAMYNDEDCGKISTFWVNSDHLMFLEKQVKMPSSSFDLDLLLKEYNYIEKRLSILYAKNSLSNIMNCLMKKQFIFSGSDMINSLILSNWKRYKLNPISGVYHCFNNYITVKKNDSLEQQHKAKSSPLTSVATSASSTENLISELLKGMIITQNDEKDIDEEANNEVLLEKIISSFNFDQKTSLNTILDWCMTKWSCINKDFHMISTDLFNEYTTTKDKLRSREMFHIGILSNKLMALHELSGMKTMQHCGIVLTFDKKAELSPHAKLSFYSDPYGENLIHEIASIKTITTNLPSCELNYPKIWLNYSPGTRSFEGKDWDTKTCNSVLPCTLALIPYYWSPLVQLTDYCTSALFNDITKEHIEIYQRIIKELIVHCIEMTLPPDIQRRVFNLTNRAVLKCFKFIALLEGQINYSKMTIQEKLLFIGIQERPLIDLIKKINTFASQGADKTLASAYLVEGVEVILSILSFIQVPYTKLDGYLRSEFNYELPIWIEAIIKLGQFLTYMQGNNMLEANIASEIGEQLRIDYQFENILMIQMKEGIETGKVKQALIDIRKVLEENSALIVDFDKDVLFIDEGKVLLIMIDGFAIDSLNKEEDDKKEEEEKEEQLWLCAACQNENDKENTRCVFCDAVKKILPKPAKPKKVERKSHFVKESLVKSTLITKMDTLKGKICEIFKESIITQCDDKNISQSPLKESIERFLYERLLLYIKEGDYFKEKVRLLKSPNKKLSNEIISLLDTPKENCMISLFTMMQREHIDFWFEDTALPFSHIEINISLMERIREVIDITISKNSTYSLILLATNLRIIPLGVNTINHSSLTSLSTIPLNLLRYYWAIIQYFNKCLEAALPYIKPPDYYSTNTSIASEEEGYCMIQLPRTISAFLSSARGIMFFFIKNELIKDVLSTTEFSENDIQTPTFKFERLAIANSIEKKQFNQRKMLSNADGDDNDANREGEDDDEDEPNRIAIEYKEEDSMFLQAYEQYKEIDPAFFRSQKVKGDPHVAFKVEFKGENVQGLGGPYRQFFSDISSELYHKLNLLQPTSNNIDKKGNYKDRYTIASCENSRTVLNHFEFLGFLMGICIRTGVRLTIDLSSIIWKKIIDEAITMDDLYQFDEGLHSMVTTLTSPTLSQEDFKLYLNSKWEIELTNGSIRELISSGSNITVNYPDRLKFVQLAIKHRLNESNSEIDSIRKGIAKIIPISLLKLLTYKEIEKLVCGEKTIDISLLQRNSNLSFDLKPESNKVVWLWEILKEMTEEDKVRFVKFCWAQERLPASDDEFKKLQIHFTIKSHIDKNKIDIFPKADTCFFNLELPEYSSKEVMKKKLIQAISLDNDSMNADKVIQEQLNRIEYNSRNYYDEDDYDYQNDYDVD